MYHFVDRPVSRLAAGGRFLLYAARGWIHAVGAGACPPGTLAPAFARHGVLPALPHFHTLVAEIHHHGRDDVALAPLGHARIVEDEAILLQLCRDAIESPARARATLTLIVEEMSVDSSFAALLTMVARLRDGGMAEIDFVADGVAGRG